MDQTNPFVALGRCRAVKLLGAMAALLLGASAAVGQEVEIRVGSTGGYQNQQATFTVTLTHYGQTVVSAQNDITATGATPIAARPDGTPDCWVNAGLGKADSSFVFLPRGCSGTSCLKVRALIFSIYGVAAAVNGCF